jgi:hypothetical protein
MVNTLKDVASFSILLFLFTYIFTLLGMELFAYRAKLDPDTNYVDLENGESPTFNFAIASPNHKLRSLSYKVNGGEIVCVIFLWKM